MTEPTDKEQYLNIADQCAATATSDLAASILVDGGNGTLRQLLNDAADAIRTGWTTHAQAAPAEQPIGSNNGWLEAAIAWEVCASLHRQYCKGKDALFTTRQSDFVKHAEDAREYASHGQAPAQAAPAAVAGPSEAVAYLDIGAGGYLDLGTDLTDEALSRLPKGRHALVIAGTYGIDGYIAAPTAQPAPQQEAQEPVMIYHGDCTIDCGEHGHHHVELLRMIPAGSKLYTAPQPLPASQGDALPREEFAWLVVREACETEPADEDDPECIRILRRDLKSSVLAAFLRHDAARAAQEGKSHG